MKAQLLAALKINGQIDKFSRTPDWEKAFDAYNLEQKKKLRPSCSSCFREVRHWLEGK